MCEDISLPDFLSVSLSESDDDVPVNRNHIILDKVDETRKMQIKNKLSYKATSDAITLMNGMPGAKITLPTNVRAIRKYSSKTLDYKIIGICERCSELNADKSMCVCGRFMEINSKRNNFLVMFPLAQQIIRLIDKHFESIISYSNRERSVDTITDLDDCEQYKKIREKNPDVHILSCTLNMDGAQVFKKSKGSLWVVQMYFNCLPPGIRFLPENIIVNTLYFGTEKPDMGNLLFTLATEFDQLTEEPIAIFKNDKFWNFLPVLIQCVCDLPARSEAQQIKGPTGKYGCSYCYEPGVPVRSVSKGSTIRYHKQTTIPLLRSHNETLLLSQRLLNENGNKDDINGVKGQSVLFLFDHIDVINSVPTDYMHNVLLGVMKHLMEIWLGKKNIPTPPYPQFKIKSVAERKLLDKRILSLKPFAVFNRKPRTIFEIGTYKATEFQNLLWYYLRYAMVGILPTRIVKNFEMLSASIYILCKPKITKSEVSSACEMLINFADEFENIYGPGAVTMNIHILRHYRQIVEKCGPLWCYAMFGFENNIGKLKNFVCGTTDVLNQITHKYTLLANHENSVNEKVNDKLDHQIVIRVEQQHISTLEREGVLCNDNILKVFRRATINSKIYNSTHSKETRSIDYFVEIENNQIGKIVYFFESKSTSKFLLHVHERNFQNFHWIEVKPTPAYEVYSTREISEKWLYFEIGEIKYITKPPNTYGRACL